MAREYVSAAVITNEIDETELAAGLAAIGPSIITTSEKGPAFKPTDVGYWPDLVAKFGNQDAKHLGIYASRLGLRKLANVKMVRLLGPDGTKHTNGNDIAPGYKVDNCWAITFASGAAENTMALIHTSGTYHLSVTDLSGGKFYLDVKNGTGVTILASTGSFNSGSDDYILKVFNDDPTRYHDANVGYYVHKVYQYNYKNVGADPVWFSSAWGTTYGDYTTGYSSASTTWIKSQQFGSSIYNLFKVHSLGDGANENTSVKVTVANARPSVSPDTTPYGTFDLWVRDYSDSDSNMSVLETFANITFDESSPNYILRRIGNMHQEYDATLKKFVPYGEYESKSKFIRVELTGSLFPNTAIPWGFEGYGKMSASIPSLPYVYDLKNSKGVYSNRLTWGIQFSSGSIDKRLAARANSKENITRDTDFSLRHVSGSTSDNYAYNTAWTGTIPASSFSSYAKFTVPLEGGFDGWDIHMSNPIDPTLINDTATYSSASWTARNALRRAVDVLSNPDEIDSNMLIIPGVYHSFITDYAIDMVTDRSDMFYVMSISGSSVTDATNWVDGLGVDTNYAGCYYPHVLIEDTYNNKRMFVDPTVIMPYVYGNNDLEGQPYYAPAGFNRAALEGIIFGVKDILDKDDRDDLQRHRVNPIAKFREGYVVWGQKTLQVKDTALNRINVRRLLIHVKKAIASIAKYLVFEQNINATWQKFENKSRPILDEIVSKYGIKKYKLQMDANTVTKENEERNEMPGKIVIYPVRTAEVIPLDFILSENGASFE